MSYYVHNIDPIAFDIGGLAFPWYWLCYLIGFLWVLLAGTYIVRREMNGLAPDQYWEHLQWGWIGLFLGARLFYVFVYNWSYFSKHPEMIPRLWQGGMSFHGAVLGILAAAWLVSRRQRTSLLAYTDILATIAPLGLAFGRVANFINGELAGRVTDLPWAVVFPRLYDELPRHPSQLYEALGEGVFLFIFLSFTAKRGLPVPGRQSILFLVGYGLIRFFIEFFRLPDQQLGTLAGLSLGQYLCLLMILGGVAIFQRKRLKFLFPPSEKP